MKQSRIRKAIIEGWRNSLANTNPKNEELCKAIRAIISRE